MKKNFDIKKLVRPNVRALKAYEAKEMPCRVKLDANESPCGFKAGIRDIQTNRYPDPQAGELKKALSKRLGVMPSNLLAGNGSDELIYYLITAFGGPVMYPTPTFVMYGMIAKAIGEKTVPVPLDSDFDIDIKESLKAIKKNKPALIFLSTPNNPTGNCFSAEKVLKIIEASRGIVVVDEAYQPFSSKKGYIPLMEDFKNLVIMRTLSKIGLAALRVGYLAAGAEIIEEVNKVRLPFNLNSYSQAIAVKALMDEKRMRSIISGVAAERARLMKGLDAIRGVVSYPSEANFILFKVEDAPGVYEKLLRKGVLVRNLDTAVRGCLRVTVGTKKENGIFLSALKEVMKG